MVSREYFKQSDGSAKIVQFADESRTLPDGSKIIYAESEDKIVLYHKVPFEAGTTYVYDRGTGKVMVNSKEGTNQDKRTMIKLGTYFLSHAEEKDLVTLNVHTKGEK